MPVRAFRFISAPGSVSLIIAALVLLIIGCSRHSSESDLNTGDAIASQPPGEVFPWPQGIVLTALDEVTIALPTAVFGKDEKIGSVLHCPVDAQISIPKQGDTFYIRLQPGMSVSLTKSCQGRVVADDKYDKKPRRFKVSGSQAKTPPEQ
jgi:hypothetical protein